MYIINKYIFLNLYFRLFWNLAFIMLIYYTPSIIRVRNEINIPMYYYVILMLIFAIQEVSFLGAVQSIYTNTI